MAARDPIGVCPLYLGHGKDGSVWFASEMKALIEDCERIEIVPPGHMYTSEAKVRPPSSFPSLSPSFSSQIPIFLYITPSSKGFIPYYKPSWEKPLEVRDKEESAKMQPKAYPEGGVLGADATPEQTKTAKDVETLLREKLEQSVVRRMMTGIFLFLLILHLQPLTHSLYFQQTHPMVFFSLVVWIQVLLQQ
jgi:hypothetical protein